MMQTSENIKYSFPQQKRVAPPALKMASQPKVVRPVKSMKCLQQHKAALQDATNQPPLPPLQHPYPCTKAVRQPRRTPSPLELYEVKRVLGAGAFGTVYMVEDRVRHTVHALKAVKKSKCSSIEQSLVLKEQKLMTDFRGNGWLVGLDASFHDSEYYYMVMPCVSGGDLEDEMRRWPGKRMDLGRVKSYMSQLVVAIKSLHASGVIHRDIKPANTLLDAEGRIVLGDFGMSTRYLSPSGATIYARESCGTPQFMAPEQYLCQKYTTSVDWWAAGIVFYALLCGHMPFHGKNAMEIAQQVLHAPLTFACNVDPKAQDLLQRLLAKDPDDRILPQAIEQHPYFVGVDWMKVKARDFSAPRIPPKSTQSCRPCVPLIPGIPFQRHNDPIPNFNYQSPGVRAALGQLAEKGHSRRRVISDPTKSHSQTRRPPPRCPSQPSLRPRTVSTRPSIPHIPTLSHNPSTIVTSSRCPPALVQNSSISPPNTPLPTPPASFLPPQPAISIFQAAKSFHPLKSLFSKLARPKRRKDAVPNVPPVPPVLHST